MKKSDWYTLYTNVGSKVYIYLAHDQNGNPLLPKAEPGEIQMVERGFDFKAFWLAETQHWALMDKIRPVKIVDHLPTANVNRTAVYQFVELYAIGQLGPRNLHLEMRMDNGHDEIWIHPRYLAEFWNRAIAWETQRLRKLKKKAVAQP